MNVDNVLEMLEDEDFFFPGSDEEFYTSNDEEMEPFNNVICCAIESIHCLLLYTYINIMIISCENVCV